MKERIITGIAIITLIGGVTAGALMSQPQEEIIEAKAQTVQEVKPTTAPKTVKSEEKEEMATNPTPTPQPVQREPEQVQEATVEPKYSETIPQFVLNKAAEYQNNRKSMNERYMSDIWWIYAERPELLQEDTYIQTLETMKSAYQSFTGLVNQAQATQKIKESL